MSETRSTNEFAGETHRGARMRGADLAREARSVDRPWAALEAPSRIWCADAARVVRGCYRREDRAARAPWIDLGGEG